MSYVGMFPYYGGEIRTRGILSAEFPYMVLRVQTERFHCIMEDTCSDPWIKDISVYYLGCVVEEFPTEKKAPGNFFMEAT